MSVRSILSYFPHESLLFSALFGNVKVSFNKQAHYFRVFCNRNWSVLNLIVSLSGEDPKDFYKMFSLKYFIGVMLECTVFAL